ncbi:MAG: CoA pyrophosphatase [Gemmatimonadetes bacterium]|nr:CoA pyrophosphatase [Gemmatimonadota bacterium]
MTAVAKHPLVARLERALAGRAPQLAERDEPFKEAAVALILRPREDDDADLLLIRRAVRAGDPWSGQIGLPGGRFEPADASLEATALRESFEEVGIDLRTEGLVLGALDEIRPRTPVLPPIIVRPYVVVLDRAPTLVLSDEVAEVRWVRLRELFVPGARVNTTVTVREYRMQVDAYQHGDFTIWGMTERILSTFDGLWR